MVRERAALLERQARLAAVRRWSAASRSSMKRTEIFAGERSDELGLAQRKKPAKCLNGPNARMVSKKPAAAAQDDFLQGLPMRAGMASGADDPCLAAAQMAQRPPAKRPREDALLEAERSHQRRRIELLDAERSHLRGRIKLLNELLDDSEAKVERLEDNSTALRTPATRSQRAELALRWFERDDKGDVEKLVSEWRAAPFPATPPSQTSPPSPRSLRRLPCTL